MPASSAGQIDGGDLDRALTGEVNVHLLMVCHGSIQMMKRTILIVDDHPSFRRFARRLLEAEGFVVVGEASDGASAVAACRRWRPQLVLLDILLPDIDGFAVADTLADEPQRPVVILT